MQATLGRLETNCWPPAAPKSFPEARCCAWRWRALIIDPLIVLADEPIGSLDRDNSLRVPELFCEIDGREDVTLVMVTHDAEFAVAASQRLRLVDGRLAD